MDVQKYINQMKDFYTDFLDFLENENENDFPHCLQKMKNIIINHDELKSLLHLIIKVSKNHHRFFLFDQKIEQILSYLSNPIKNAIHNIELFKISRKNKRILLYFLKNQILTIDQSVLKYMESKSTYYHFFYPEIKNLINQKEIKIDEEVYLSSDFDKKRQLGENDSYICSLIRQDLIEDFVAYVNRTNLSLSSRINSSIFETNSFLINKNPTLIEYSAFYGSIQIFQYLRLNGVKLPSSLWNYVIHSKNAELIHILEENHVKPNKNNYENIFIESIKCHHNDIANYIEDNYLIFNNNYDEINFNKIVESNAIRYHNYYYFKKNLNRNFSLYFLCQYEYNELAHLFIKENEINRQKLICQAIDENQTDSIYYLLSKKDKIDEYLFKNKQKLEMISIPSSILSICGFAFYGCKSLTQIYIPLSVTSICDFAFCKCTSLKRVSIPLSVTKIGCGAFERCSSLKKIEIPSSVNQIGNNAFIWCSSLQEILIFSDFITFGINVIKGCCSLKQVLIPPTETKIEDDAFNEFLSLTQISIPSSVTSIGNNAFYRCSSLAQISFEIPSFLTSIGAYAFARCTSLTKISIPFSVTSIGGYAFRECSSLAQITIPSSVTSIGDYAFDKCSSLTRVSIPSSVTSIGNFVFAECSSLAQISIPSSVTSIGNGAFYGCLSLTQISLPSSITSIGDGAFNGCSKLTQISIPSSVTSIRDGTFNGCSKLTQISIPSSVTSIRDSAFLVCSSLAQITIPSSVTSIGNSSFSGCSSLTQITIPSSVTSIGSFVFANCTSLTQISIPSSIASIGKNIFNGCSSLINTPIPSCFYFDRRYVWSLEL